MAQLHTAMPDHLGERELVRQLLATSDRALHIWCGIHFIKNVTDVDLILWHELAGLFVVEVKAFPISHIESFGYSSCKIKDRSQDAGPVVQALKASESLKDWLAPDGFNEWRTHTAAWPQITRSEWNARWDDQRVCGSYAESMLFRDDFYSEPQILIERLHHIRSNPPSKKGPRYKFVHRPEKLHHLRRLLDVNAKPVPTPSDCQRLKTLEAEVEQEEKNRVPPYAAKRLYYHGKPGTGKTFRLLRIGLWHASEGRRVLYICFNKVLAADIQRMLSLSQKLASSQGSLEARDCFDILRFSVNEEIEESDYDTWAVLVLESMRADPSQLRMYDTILIDEAQDLPNWAFDMALLQSDKTTTILIATDGGQELYSSKGDSLEVSSEAELLRAFKKNARPVECRDVFRNTERIAKLALLFQRADGDVEKVQAEALRLQSASSAMLLLRFKRPGGNPPSLVALDDNELESIPENSPFYQDLRDDIRTKQYAEIIADQQRQLHDDQRLMDILVLVPDHNCDERRWAFAALSQLKLDFLDYTDKAKRRFIPQPHLVRLCTFHSSRGIEGQKVIVFGLEKLPTVAKYAKASATKLGSIVLTRTSIDLTVVYRPLLQSKVISLIQSSVTALK